MFLYLTLASEINILNTNKTAPKKHINIKFNHYSIMMNHILKHQSFITFFLSGTLLILIIIQILDPGLDLEGPFSIIAGWLGIVIGFFLQ